ncbi:AraC family transcriptional regulator [Anaerofustis stercorihominis]|uniref:Transcriptional regulator, effector binding domain protein n=3 Tax=Anaerofustis stercorihominis TaxID=214853 RepID=B1C7P9_9FIRM|nr:effector binding domain-containing protein [Anaerofustis stercorihominis]EDS73036.1 transcriptional regulator, effector binding domain protein [Anaerofustis stercorihominis DSM 17244]MCQ4794351.1 AraC family transcriptional regulator [Anaerofustis stercorihominis]
MQWNEKLQIIIDYVEDHLQRKEESIDRSEIEKIAGCSYGFFQKVFSYMNDISFSEYIRLRKLTLAGYDLKSSDIKVVDLSYKYGYDSPTSFTKAFQQFHGVSPSEARKGDIKLNVYPKMRISVKQKYSWKIEHTKPFRLIGKSIKVLCNENADKKIPEIWSNSQKDGTFHNLVLADTADNKGMFGVMRGYDKEKNEMEYSVMVISDKELPDGFTEIMVPEASWAIFDLRGAPPKSVQECWKYLNEEWILNYPFKHANCPELEWYSDGNVFDEDYLSQIWIPIIEEE